MEHAFWLMYDFYFILLTGKTLETRGNMQEKELRSIATVNLQKRS